MDAAELLALYEAGETDFQGLNLENIDLSDADLSGADLSNANLSDADLSGADLSNANLSNANLSATDLSDADLSHTNLNEANLSHTNLSDANLVRADLNDANLNDANLVRADLSGANLSDADLTDANLTDANLTGTKLNVISLINIDLSVADLSGVDLSGADLSSFDLSSIDLSGAKLNLVNLTGTIIDNETKLDDKWYFIWQIVNRQFNSLKQERYYQLSLFNSFHHDNYVGRDLSNSCLRNSDITGLNLSFSILYRADCTNTNFTDTKLYCANFHSANLRGANFTNADLRYAILIEANLEGADFTNADLRYANLQGLDLKDTEGAKILQFDDISCSWNQLNDEQFELLCYDIIKEKHHPNEIHKIGKSRSRDGGRDIVFYKRTDINKKPIKWIAQCKLKSDKGSLGSSQVPHIRDMLDQYNAEGFCILTSGIIDATLHDRLDTLKEDKGFEVERWSYLEIERFLAEHPEIKARYFQD
ncbi:MAG: pentapeptide repeat-containing protein [Aphanizomenon gracile PMC638.10]|nr:pentapeptide repeat-containing protein [Aphanizomenon gracile PMC638.10]